MLMSRVGACTGIRNDVVESQNATFIHVPFKLTAGIAVKSVFQFVENISPTKLCLRRQYLHGGESPCYSHSESTIDKQKKQWRRRRGVSLHGLLGLNGSGTGFRRHPF